VDDRKLERVGAWAGIVFVVLVLVTALLPGSPPKTSDSVGKIAKFFVDKSDEIRITTYVGGLATVAVLFWLAALYRTLRRADSSGVLAVAALAGGVVTTALIGVGGVLMGVVSIIRLQAGIAPIDIRFFYVLSTNLTIAGGFSLVVLLVATSWAIVNTRVMPTWVAVIGGLDALLWLVGCGAVTSTKDFIFYIAFAGFLVFAIWVLIVSIFMLRTDDRAPAAVPATAAAETAAA
jgi:hypothetical protein